MSIATLMTAGCANSRRSYRPIYATPAPVAAPCTNCGSSSASVTTDEPVSSGTVTSVPSLVDTPSQSTTPPIRSGSGSSRGQALDKTPKSRIDDEPGLDENLSPAPASGLGGGTSPPPPPKPVSPGSGSASGPDLQGPTGSATPSAWETDAQEGVQTAATPASRVRPASMNERLRPFIDDSTANDLMYPNKVDRPWRYIVLHHSASASGNYDQIDAEHRKILGIDGCGYHFVIGNGTGSRDGQIEVSQRWINQKQGAHTRNARTHDADEYGIGICLVGNFDQQPPSSKQIAATKALIDYLNKRYNIGPQGLRTHAHMAATKTVCPGKFFPSEAMLMVTKDAMTERPVRATWKVVHDTTQK